MAQVLNRLNRKTFVGIVVSTKMQKTIVVKVETKFMHAKLKKLVISHKKYHVHDEKGEAKDGDEVSFIETRPYSKTKSYRLSKITKKAS
ncbi:MAG: 30S ribosomal protein S17 [Mycoplasmataceae bacterium]|jgi:small subunit ribosomal protein S17|nr:30S ribosomal protein S17 [Mycoplasmataceae bacterium]